MALDPNSAAGQLDGIYTKLSAFYTAAANHVSNTSGSVVPASSSDLESMVSDSRYPWLYRLLSKAGLTELEL